MKNIIKILSLLILLTAVQSCEDFLSVPNPSTQLSEELALGTEAGIRASRAYMYTQLHTVDYTTEYMLAPSSLADGLFITPGSKNYFGLNTNNPGNTLDTWYTSYEMINQANILIHAIPKGVVSKETRKQFRGEAYFIRAFAYHTLVKAYAYEPGVTPNRGQGEGFTLGVPIVTKPTFSLSDADYHPRAPVVEVYELIESDLLTAIDLLSQVSTGARRYATQAAAEALLARVYLYWRKYNKAEKYATLALRHSPARLATPEEVGTLFNAGTTVEVIWRRYVSQPSTESLGVNDALSAFTSLADLGQAPTQDQMDLYSKNDARLAWFGRCYLDLDDQPVQCNATHPAIANGTVTVELQKWNGDLGNYADNVPYLRAAEMVLIQAEARLKMGNIPGALNALNNLRTSRGLKKYSGSKTEDAIMHAILIERRREFIGEGQRFYDLKRLGMDIRKAPETISETIQPVPFANRRILANIPFDVVALSQQAVDQGIIPPDSAITQNPGY